MKATEQYFLCDHVSALYDFRGGYNFWNRGWNPKALSSTSVAVYKVVRAFEPADKIQKCDIWIELSGTRINLCWSTSCFQIVSTKF